MDESVFAPTLSAPRIEALGLSERCGQEKTLETVNFQGFCVLVRFDQRLLNCSARRAALRPYSRSVSPEAIVFTCFFGIPLIRSLSY